MGNLGFFQLIKNSAETTLLIDEEYISQAWGGGVWKRAYEKHF